MAGEWIKVDRSTPDKPEVLRISRELAIDRDAVFGKLMLVWMWFDVNSCNGVVDGAVDADVDALVRHDGFARVMRAVKWLHDAPSGTGLLLPNFARHNGETAKKRALSNRRQSRWRNSAVDGRVDGKPSTTASTREEKRRIKEDAPPSGGPVWNESLAILNEQGISEKSARAFLGMLCRDWDEELVADAVRASVGKADATAYVRGVLRSHPKKGSQSELRVAMP